MLSSRRLLSPAPSSLLKLLQSKPPSSSSLSTPLLTLRPFSTSPSSPSSPPKTKTTNFTIAPPPTPTPLRHPPPSTSSSALLKVALLGPPNAGKSTLFNLFLRQSSSPSQRLGSLSKSHRRQNGANRGGGKAIVSPVAGTTRDRRESLGGLGPVEFFIVDTAGVDEDVMSLSGNSSNSSKAHSRHTARRSNMGENKERNVLSSYASYTSSTTLSPISLKSHHSAVALNDKIKGEEVIVRGMGSQVLAAAIEADLILLLFDAKNTNGGGNFQLKELATWLRRNVPNSSSKTVLLANKLEGDAWTGEGSVVMEGIEEASSLGFGEVVPISAEHGDGMGELGVLMHMASEEKRLTIEALGLASPSTDDEDDEDEDEEDDDSSPDTTRSKPINIAILGRPNVGKSSLLNCLLGYDRVITGATPGLTRDAIAVDFQYNDRKIQVVDTAGIRKSARREKGEGQLEDRSVEDSMRAMKLAHVCVLVLDAHQGVLTKTELSIADSVIVEGRALVVVANKADVLEKEMIPMEYARRAKEQIEALLPQVGDVVVVPTSCLKKGDSSGIDFLLPVVEEVFDKWNSRVNTAVLNRWFKDVIFSHSPPKVKGRLCKLKYITQTKTRPPTFRIFANAEEKDIGEAYMKYLRNSMRSAFGMQGFDLRISVSNTNQDNPFATKGEVKK